MKNTHTHTEKHIHTQTHTYTLQKRSRLLNRDRKPGFLMITICADQVLHTSRLFVKAARGEAQTCEIEKKNSLQLEAASYAAFCTLFHVIHLRKKIHFNMKIASRISRQLLLTTGHAPWLDLKMHLPPPLVTQRERQAGPGHGDECAGRSRGLLQGTLN